MMLVSQGVDAVFGGVIGLLLGSFLNVVIYRLPRMLEAQWAAEYAEISGQEPTQGQPFNLMVPRSRCPHCGHQIRWYENIPVVSWLALRGRCSQCRKPISFRYPLVELVTAAFFFVCGLRFGLEGCYRSLARLAGTVAERVRLVDLANSVRPKTLT